MNLKQLIIKTETKRNKILKLIEKAKSIEEAETEIEMEAYLRELIYDLKQLKSIIWKQ